MIFESDLKMYKARSQVSSGRFVECISVKVLTEKYPRHVRHLKGDGLWPGRWLIDLDLHLGQVISPGQRAVVRTASA